MVVGFTTTCAISACLEFEPVHGEVNLIQHYAINLSVTSTNKTDHHDITEILLKVAINTINPNQTKSNFAEKDYRPADAFTR